VQSVDKPEGHEMLIDKENCKQDELKALSDSEVTKHLPEVPHWSLKGMAIERELKFKDFKEAMEFVNRIAVLAETEDHHPDICISYNKVRLTLSTHKVGGLSCKDFILGAKINLAASAR
jgi:4a-hydroxytetrahydrobiopterin dehydratase